jgi:hypothetical protein
LRRYVEAAAERANSGADPEDPMGNIGAMLSSPELYGGAVRVEFSLPIAWKRLVPTLEPNA